MSVMVPVGNTGHRLIEESLEKKHAESVRHSVSNEGW